MDERRWEKLKDLIEQAAELTPDARIIFCNGIQDVSLREEVRTLLAHHATGEFLEGSPLTSLFNSTADWNANVPFSSGEIIAERFQIISFVGRGGMAEVYKAEDLRLRRLVALKTLPATTATDPEFRRRFEREAQTASALAHPHICTIYDLCEHNGRAFIAMELLEGQTLKQLLQEAPLTLAQTLKVGGQIADALEAAHNRSIIHRDIKPDNIFINGRGDVKGLDFGLAKLSRELKSGEHPTHTDIDALTRHGTALGTVAYMSPEQARGEKLDCRTDLFSFGLVLYEMSTGRRAFSGTTAMIFAALLNDTPVLPSDLNPKVPKDLERIILKAIEKDRDRRFQSASEMSEVLEKLSDRDRIISRALISNPWSGIKNEPWTRLHNLKWVGLLVVFVILLMYLRTGGNFMALVQRKADGKWLISHLIWDDPANERTD